MSPSRTVSPFLRDPMCASLLWDEAPRREGEEVCLGEGVRVGTGDGHGVEGKASKDMRQRHGKAGGGRVCREDLFPASRSPCEDRPSVLSSTRTQATPGARLLTRDPESGCGAGVTAV